MARDEEDGKSILAGLVRIAERLGLTRRKVLVLLTIVQGTPLIASVIVAS